MLNKLINSCSCCMFACDDDYDNDQEVAKHNFFSQPSPAVISQKKYPFALPASHLQGHGEEISSQFARMHVYFFSWYSLL